MPTKDWNRKIWDGSYSWEQAGDEWSRGWGSPEAQWFGSLYPRFHEYLPVKRVLEIGPGFGRWSQYLLDHCEQLELVDLSASCIDACRKRFASYQNINYHVNDGSSLEMVADNSIDLVFSFDSLVHADAGVMNGYLGEIAKKLSINGVGIIHHSNLGQYAYFHVLRAIEGVIKPRGSIAYEEQTSSVEHIKKNRSDGMKNLVSGLLLKTRILDRTHMRALSMTAEKFRSMAAAHNLECISQELVRWGASRRLIDCISVFTRKDSVFNKDYVRLENRRFMQEAEYIRRLYGLYGPVPAKGDAT